MTELDEHASGTVTINVPLSLRRRGGRKIVIAADGGPAQAKERPDIDTKLVKAIARAYRWQRLLEEGRYGTMRELAEVEKISRSYVSRLMCLATLSPALVEDALDGKASTLDISKSPIVSTPIWNEQA